MTFCKHYGTVLLPTKPDTPRHKGKIQSGIKYVKHNSLKDRRFASLTEQNDHLTNWESNVDERRDGTAATRQTYRRSDRSLGGEHVEKSRCRRCARARRTTGLVAQTSEFNH